jgi:hypothetical protein
MKKYKIKIKKKKNAFYKFKINQKKLKNFRT